MLHNNKSLVIMKLGDDLMNREINFTDHPISSIPSLPTPKFLNNIQREISPNSNKPSNRTPKTSSQIVLKNTDSKVNQVSTFSPYKEWAKNNIQHCKERCGEFFGEPCRLKNKIFKIKRNEYGLIQCTQKEMEQMWIQKQFSVKKINYPIE